MFNPNKVNAKPEGSIVNGIVGAAGLAVDTSCTLYVANISANTVTIYPRGYTSPKSTISDGLSWPYGIGLDSQGKVTGMNLIGADKPQVAVRLSDAGSTQEKKP